MPNVHRFQLMGWPFDQTPHLKAWFERVAKRPSYRQGLLNWQGEDIPGLFGGYTEKRRAEGTDVRTYGGLSDPG